MELDVASLKESRDFLNGLYQDVTTAIFLADGDARIQHFNDAFKALFLPKDEQVLGQLCGNVIGCAFQVDEGRDCGHTSNCASCPLRTDIIRSFTERVPVYHDMLVRELVIDGRRELFHFRFSTKYAMYKGCEYVLVLVDNVSELENARLAIAESNRALARKNGLLERELRRLTFEFVRGARDLERLTLDRNNLFHEVQHRVGNNLQLISSLLNLEGREGGCGDGEAESLRRLRSRIGAVASAYGACRYIGGLALVGVQELFRSLAGDVISSLSGTVGRAVIVESTLDHLENAVAVPVAIILVEILSEALVRAEGRPGSASLRLEVDGVDAKLLVTVKGAVGAVDLPSLRLAQIMAEQVGGSIASVGGACELSFPVTGAPS